MTIRTLRLSFILSRLAARERDFESKINILANKFKKFLTESEIRDQIIPLDPSENKKYLNWICERVAERNVRLPEDGQRVRTALTTYQDVTRSKREMERFGVQPDIGFYKTLQDLEKVHRLVHGIQYEKSDERYKEIPKGARLIYDEKPYRVIRIGGLGIPLEDAVQASIIYGEDTAWCTQQEENATIYLKRGPLYVISKYHWKPDKGSNKIHTFKEAQTDGIELRDIQDEEITIQDDPDLWEFLNEHNIIKKAIYLYQVAKYMAKGVTDEEVRIIATDKHAAFLYAKQILHGEFPEGEKAISRDLEYSYHYAFLIKKPFPLGEPVIAKNGSYAINYAQYILRGPFPLGEPAIAKEESLSYRYAVDVLNKPFPLGEDAISKNSNLSMQYVEKFKIRVPKFEAILSQDSGFSVLYAQVIGKRFLEGEEAISKNPYASLNYAKFLGERFLAGEAAIAKSPPVSIDYAKLFGRFEKGEPKLAEFANYAFKYAQEVLGGRFLLAEQEIFSSNLYRKKYIDFIKEKTGEDITYEFLKW